MLKKLSESDNSACEPLARVSGGETILVIAPSEIVFLLMDDTRPAQHIGVCEQTALVVGVRVVGVALAVTLQVAEVSRMSRQVERSSVLLARRVEVAACCLASFIIIAIQYIFIFSFHTHTLFYIIVKTVRIFVWSKN